jgi:hypothetical protein
MPHRQTLPGVLALAALLASGCAATVGTGTGIYVPSDAANTCRAQCQSIDLGLGAVVVIANNVGCVCQPRGTQAAQSGSVAVAGGMAAVMQIQQAQQQQKKQ